MKNLALILLSLFLLTACNLSASLLNGSGEEAFTATYAHDGQEHTMTATVTATDGVVTGFKMESGAQSGRERAHQMAFGANVRQYMLNTKVELIDIPGVVGIGNDAERLTGIFREQILTELQK